MSPTQPDRAAVRVVLLVVQTWGATGNGQVKTECRWYCNAILRVFNSLITSPLKSPLAPGPNQAVINLNVLIQVSPIWPSQEPHLGWGWWPSDKRTDYNTHRMPPHPLQLTTIEIRTKKTRPQAPDGRNYVTVTACTGHGLSLATRCRHCAVVSVLLSVVPTRPVPLLSTQKGECCRYSVLTPL